MLGIKKLNPTARAIGTVGAVVALAGGVTFASLSSQATLTNNTISSATADLLVASTAGFSHSEPGFAFTGIVPGSPGTPSSNHDFSLDNNGDVDFATVDVQATTPGSEPNITDNSLVHVNFHNVDTAQNFSYSLAQLISAPRALTPIPNINNNPDHVDAYTVNVSMDNGAVSDGHGEVSSFNLVFTGTTL